MEKLITREEKSKKSRRNQIVLVAILAVLMLFSTVAYALMDRGDDKSNPNILEYNGVVFYNDGSYWRFDYAGYSYVTKYNPNETLSMPVLTDARISDFIDKPLYIVSPKGDSYNEVYLNFLRSSITERLNDACVPNMNCTDNVPVKNCSKDMVIIIKEPEKNQDENIYQDENCIFITAQYSNQTKYVDAFLFEILGI